MTFTYMPVLLQLLLAGVWASTVIVHMRRLFRLACVAQLRNWEEVRLRSGWNRIWWWLGQDEFWTRVRYDTWQAIQVTLMIFLIAWSFS
jgi:hypothetical protein